MYVFVWGIMEFNKKSTGLSLGNLVDGLPGALHNTEALWGGQGVFGPVPIDTLAKKKIINIRNSKLDSPNVLGI